MYYPITPFIKYPNVESQLLKRNPAKTKELVEWLCITPSRTTYRVNFLQCTAEKVKSELIKVVEETHGVTPSIHFIDDIPEVIILDSLEKCKCIYTEKLKDNKEIIVDAKCGAAVLRGAHIYAPGVLAMQSGTKLGDSVCVFADLSGTCRRGTNIVFTNEYKTFIAIGIVKMQRHSLFGENLSTRGVAIEIQQTISGVPTLPTGHLTIGDALLQNLPSIICCRVLNPRKDDVVLDMCAAPGNKTTHIAQMMENKGLIIAIDKTESRVKLLDANLEAFGVKIVHSFIFDSMRALQTELEISSDKKVFDGPPFPLETFDKILLDAPCSGFGNRPVLANPLSEKMLSSYSGLQKNLLKSAYGLLKPGGTLVYSTCTVTEEENELMVHWFLSQYERMELVEASPVFGGPGLQNTGLTNEQRNYVQRFSCTDNRRNVDSVAFFIAKFIKIDTRIN